MPHSDGDEDFREHLTFVLTLIGDPGIDRLVDLARHDASARVRGQALFWVAQKAGERAVGTLAGAVDDVCGHASLGEAPGVGAVVVVLVEVFGEVLGQRGALGDQ